MTSYFPLPVNFICCKKNISKVISSLDITNLPNNVLEKNLNHSNHKDLFFHSYLLHKNQWVRHDIQKCLWGETINFTREKLSIDDNQMIVVIKLDEPNGPRNTRYLPKPCTNRLDKSPTAERASYNFHINNKYSSYQGEYPYEMTNLTRASFFSFNPLNVKNKSDIDSYVILMNLNKDANNNNNHKVTLYESYSKKIIEIINTKTNSITPKIMPNNSNVKLKQYKGPLFLSCSTASFIPIYLNIQKGSNQSFDISVEHTHPPTEMIWGTEKFKFAKKLKSNWILK